MAKTTSNRLAAMVFAGMAAVGGGLAVAGFTLKPNPEVHVPNCISIVLSQKNNQEMWQKIRSGDDVQITAFASEIDACVQRETQFGEIILPALGATGILIMFGCAALGVASERTHRRENNIGRRPSALRAS